MKEKILAQLKAKYAGVSLVLLGIYADKLVAKVTAEDQIQGAIDELESLPITIQEQNLFYQTEGDRRATEAASTRENKLKEQFNFVAKNQPPTPPTPPVQGNEEIEALKKRLDAFERNEIRSKRLSSAIHLLEEKKIPKRYYSKILEKSELAAEEDVQKAVEEIETDFTAFKQSMIDEGVLSIERPVFGVGVNPDSVSPAMQKFIETTQSDQSNPLGAKTL